MKIIAHRGNLYGPNLETENTIEQAEKCFVFGFAVELDIWVWDAAFYLGHSAPKTFVARRWILDNLHRVKLHAKNQEAAYELAEIVDVFCHRNDPFVFTSRRNVWFYPGSEIQKQYNVGRQLIACLPELAPDWDLTHATHICTDYPVKYAEMYAKGK